MMNPLPKIHQNLEQQLFLKFSLVKSHLNSKKGSRAHAEKRDNVKPREIASALLR